MTIVMPSRVFFTFVLNIDDVHVLDKTLYVMSTFR